jgi:hypothetical protein
VAASLSQRDPIIAGFNGKVIMRRLYLGDVPWINYDADDGTLFIISYNVSTSKVKRKQRPKRLYSAIFSERLLNKNPKPSGQTKQVIAHLLRTIVHLGNVDMHFIPATLYNVNAGSGAISGAQCFINSLYLFDSTPIYVYAPASSGSTP